MSRIQRKRGKQFYVTEVRPGFLFRVCLKTICWIRVVVSEDVFIRPRSEQILRKLRRFCCLVFKLLSAGVLYY